MAEPQTIEFETLQELANAMASADLLNQSWVGRNVIQDTGMGAGSVSYELTFEPREV